MKIFIDLAGWSIQDEEPLLAWLADEARQESLEIGEVQFVLVGNDEIRELNEQYLQHEGPTDVITFDFRAESDAETDESDADDEAEFDENETGFGAEPAEVNSELDDIEDFPDAEIYVSLQKAHEQAIDFGCTITEEVSRLLLHGILHLAGWDDDTAAKRRAMNNREDEGLARAGRGTGVLAWQVNHPVEQRG
ncbi:rRNA maturation RNase YbeY [bacterium]|nr:rRNA maturation RNase YbeY [bacterium]